MAISLNKGGNLSLSKSEPSLRKISVGLGWQARVTSGADFDLDASCFLLDANAKMRSDDDFIFYNQLKSADGAVEHQGDILSGSGAGDDEQIMVELARVSTGISKLVFTVTIHDAEARRQNFGQVQNAFIRVVNSENGNEIVRYDLSEDASSETAMIFGELYRHNSEWKFRAVGQGFAGGLSALLKHFGGEEATNAAPSTSTPIPPTPAPRSTPPPVMAPPAMAPRSAPVSPPTPAAPKLNLGKVTLDKKGEKTAISLQKGGGVQPVRVNLNWEAPQKKGFFASLSGGSAPDLDLGCLYRLKNGQGGVIQPLGQSFGSQNSAPFIFLDKDDRSGAAQDGENLTIFRPDEIELVSVFAMIYEGATDFHSVNGRVTIKDQSGNEILIRLNAPERGLGFCLVANIRNLGGHIEISKEERYFKNIMGADDAYGYGFEWRAGSK